MKRRLFITLLGGIICSPGTAYSSRIHTFNDRTQYHLPRERCVTLAVVAGGSLTVIV